MKCVFSMDDFFTDFAFICNKSEPGYFYKLGSYKVKKYVYDILVW